MQSAQQKRRLSKDNITENESSHPNTSSLSHKDVPKRNLPVIPHDHNEMQNSARANPFTNSLADQLKIRLEERRKNSDESEVTNLAADVQKAVNIANESKPTDTGIIPPEYRTAFHTASLNQASSTTSNSVQHSLQSINSENSTGEKKPHQWSTNPVEEWAKEQVCQWLLALGMESYITLFMDRTITGAALLNLDSSGLKDLGIKNKDDREKIKKKIKELKSHNDKEKKDIEKEKSKREKLLKKAEKTFKKK